LELLAPTGGDLSQEIILTVVEGATGMPVNVDDWDYVNVAGGAVSNFGDCID